MGRGTFLTGLVAVASFGIPAVRSDCGGCYVQADAVAQVWDSMIHYYTVGEEQYVVDNQQSATQLVNFWVPPDPDAVMSSYTNSLFDSAMHRGFNYEIFPSTAYTAGSRTLVYPTSYLWVQYLTKFFNTTRDGQCITGSSTKTLSPQLLYTIDPNADKDWLTTLKKENGDLTSRLNRLPQNIYASLPGFEGCNYGQAVGSATTKAPVLSTTNTIISYASSWNMHINPVVTAAPGQGASGGSTPAMTTSMPGMNHPVANFTPAASMSMNPGDKMELCDLLTVGYAVFTGTNGTFPIGDKTLSPGGSPITLFGTVITEPPVPPGSTPNVVMVGASTQTFAKSMMRADEVNSGRRPSQNVGVQTSKTNGAARGWSDGQWWRLGLGSWLVVGFLGGVLYL